MVSPVRFDGKDLYTPGYYSKREISKLNQGAASGSNLLLIGECTGGIPYNATTAYPNADDRVNWISNTTQNKEVIKSGPAYTGTLFALTPSNDPGINGAPRVGVIRVNKAVQSSLTLLDKDTDNVLDLKSAGFGIDQNQVNVTVTAGTNKGKKITTKFQTTEIVSDDTTYELFTLIYTGAGSAAAVTLDPVGNLVITITGGGAGDDITLDLTAYTDMNAVVAALNAHVNTALASVYTAVLVGDGGFKSAKLDEIIVGDAVDVKTVQTFEAQLEAAWDHFKNNNELIADPVLSTSYQRRPLANLSLTYFTGGTEGAAVTSTEWQGALDMAKLIDASFVVVMTGDPAVHAALSAHVTYMNGTSGRNERQGGCGNIVTDITKAAKLAAVAAINNAAVDYCGTEVKRYDDDGILQTYEGFYAQAMIKGMQAGNDITFAPTNKQMNVIGVKEKYSDTDRDDYIKGGVQIIQPSDLGGFRTVRSITTFQGSNKIANESSAMRTILFVTKDHRVFVEASVGVAGDSTALESINNSSELRLEEYEEQGYFIVDPDQGNSFRNYDFTVEADVIKISYEATIVLPINFILVTHNFTVIGNVSAT